MKKEIVIPKEFRQTSDEFKKSVIEILEKFNFEESVNRIALLYEQNDSLKNAKDWMRDNWKEHDITCVACNQKVHLYRRKLNSGMASFLIGLYTLCEGNVNVSFHYSEVIKLIGFPANDYANMIHFGLIESDESKKAGYFSITLKGILFLQGKLKIPEKIFLYNQKYYGSSPKEISFIEALGKRFEMLELIKDKTFYGGIKVI